MVNTMAQILYFKPGCDVIKEESENLGTWFLESFPVGSVLPRGLKLYKNSVSDENDITDKWRDEISVVLDNNANYIVVEFPNGPVLPFVPYIVAAIIAVAATLLLAPGVTGVSSTNNSNTSSNNSLQGRTNESRPGKRIADIRGLVRAYPDLLMNYTIFKDGIEYENQFLCLGAGEYYVTDISDGITPITNVSGTKVSIYSPGTSPGNGSPSTVLNGGIDLVSFPIVEAKESNEVDGAELLPPNYADVSAGNLTFTIYSTGQIDAVSNDTGNPLDWSERTKVGDYFTISGFISLQSTGVSGRYFLHDLSGTYIVTGTSANGVLLNVSANPNWGFLSPTGQTPVTTVYALTDGTYSLTNVAGSTRVDYTLSMDSNNPYVVGPYLMTDANKILVNAVAQSGIYRRRYYITPFDVTLRISVTDYNNPSNPQVNFDFVVPGSQSATGASYMFVNPYPDAAYVSMRRITDTTLNESISTIDSVKWRDMYGINVIGTPDYGNVTLIHSVTEATSAALKLKQRKLNMLATRIYNNAASKNFADVIMSMHLDPFFGRRGIDTIDVDALYSVQNQILDYFGDQRAIEVGYTFDDLSTTYEEALQVICAAVNVTPYQIGSVLYFWPELPQEASAMQFGHAFKVPDSDKRTRSFSPVKNYTGIQVKYYDHDADSYQYVTVGEETNLNKIDLLACQSKWLATVRAKREYNKLQYQRITHECTTLSIGLQAAPGMRIDMIDNTRLSQMEGVITDVNDLILTLSDPVTFINGNNYSITLTHALGTLENIPITAGDDEFSVVMAHQPSEQIYTGWLRDRTSYVIRTDDQRTKLAMLVQSMEPSGRDNNYQVNLTCINYDARYYQDDLN